CSLYAFLVFGSSSCYCPDRALLPSLHDALPICGSTGARRLVRPAWLAAGRRPSRPLLYDESGHPGAPRPAPLFRAQPDYHGELRSEEHTSELQSRENIVCCLLL